MTSAYVVGAGQTPFGAFPDASYRSLFRDAYEAALESADGDLSSSDVDEAVIGTLGVGGRQLGLSGPAVTEHVGLSGVPCSRIENACAAGGFAVRQAVQAVQSGMADLVVAGGFEVMTDMSGDLTKYWLGVSGETEWERLTGTTFAGVYAQMASAYMDSYDVDTEPFSRVAVKNHDNGAANPDAHLGFPCSLEDAEGGPAVADPLTLYHCCPTSDGAAVVLVAREAFLEGYDGPAVRVRGVGAASDTVGLADRDTYTGIPASERAANTAYEMADMTPDDVDFGEVHDCFAIAELLAYEDLGFCGRGEAPRLLEAGETDLDGSLPVNPSGGLKSKGHPIGATGTGQVVEVFKQLTGRAGERQVSNAATALTHNVGGSGGAAVVHLFERGAGV